MTAYIDSKFTAATSLSSGTPANSAQWANPERALSFKTFGAATVTVAAGDFSRVLRLTGTDIAIPEDADVTGVVLRVWGSSTTQSGVQPIYWANGLTIGEYRRSFVTFSLPLGPANWQPDQPPVTPQEFGSPTSVGDYRALSLSQVKSNIQLDLEFFNLTAAPRVLSIWAADVRFYANLPSMQDVVQRAFRKVAVLSKDEEITGDDLAHGLDLLNDMIFGWEAFGVDIGHVEREAGEAFPIARRWVEGTSMQLASRLSQDYQVSPVQSKTFFDALRRAYNPDDRTDYRDLDDDGEVSDEEAAGGERARFF